jgi:hypothetical protein
MQLKLRTLPGSLAVCRLETGSSLPNWAVTGELSAAIRSPGELTIICNQAAVPPGIQHEPDWRAIGVLGRLDFSLTGVLAALAQPLAEAGVSIFALSTFDTDYILVKESALQQALEVLQLAGHQIVS